MLYYLSLLTHTDQLAFFRLFKYLTFRSGAAVVTALMIAFLINPHNLGKEKQVREAQSAANSIGMQFHVFDASSANDIDAAFAAMVQRGGRFHKPVQVKSSRRKVWCAKRPGCVAINR